MKTILTICLIFQTLYLFSQQENANSHNIKIGLGFSYFPVTGVQRFFGRDEHVPEIHGKKFYSAGISSIYSFNINLAIESGAMFGKYYVNVVPWGPDRTGYIEDVSILYLPLSLRYSFAKFVFITSGLLFEFDISEPGELQNQSGIGLMLGPGFYYEYRNGISLYINPFLNVHSLISYDYGLNSDKIFEGSIRLGFLYRL